MFVPGSREKHAVTSLSNNLFQIYSRGSHDMLSGMSNNTAVLIEIVKDIFVDTNSITVPGNALLVGYIWAKLSTDFFDELVEQFHQEV